MTMGIASSPSTSRSTPPMPSPTIWHANLSLRPPTGLNRPSPIPLQTPAALSKAVTGKTRYSGGAKGLLGGLGHGHTSAAGEDLGDQVRDVLHEELDELDLAVVTRDDLKALVAVSEAVDAGEDAKPLVDA